MLSESALDQKAKSLGLQVGDDVLARKIEQSPEFAGPGGFNHDYFLMALRSIGMTESQYVDEQRRLMLRQQLGQALVSNLTIPKVMSEALRRYQNEERAIDYITLGKPQAGEIPSPTPEQLKSFYDEHKVAFRAPEYRKLQMIVLTPESIAAGIEISDAELQKAYESEKDRLATPEKRDVDQIVFDKPEDAATAAARLASGLSFDALAAERKLTSKDTSLGLVTKREILDPAVANAAFALPVGKTSAPVTGRFGTVILRVSKIEPSIQKPFADVANDLRKQIAMERGRRQLLDLHDKIEDERASGATISEIAAKLNVKFETFDALDRSGRKPDGTKVAGVQGSPEVLGPAFSAPVGTDNDTVDLKNQGGYVWFDVASITPSHERPFDEVKAQVEARWKDEEAGKKLAALADTIRTKLNSGEPFAQAAPGISVAHRDRLRRTQTAEGFDGAAIAKIFDTPQGKSGVLETSDDVSRIVYRVTVAMVPASAVATANNEAMLSRGLQDDVLSQYVRRLQNDLGVSINQAAIRSITGADRN
jgi:peptidyl-prolyl cis-trans isomerase D